MTELVVYLDGQLCGRIEQSSSGNITFRYEREYREADDPTPLSLSMQARRRDHRILTGSITGSAVFSPEGP